MRLRLNEVCLNNSKDLTNFVYFKISYCPRSDNYLFHASRQLQAKLLALHAIRVRVGSQRGAGKKKVFCEILEFNCVKLGVMVSPHFYWGFRSMNQKVTLSDDYASSCSIFVF